MGFLAMRGAGRAVLAWAITCLAAMGGERSRVKFSGCAQNLPAQTFSRYRLAGL